MATLQFYTEKNYATSRFLLPQLTGIRGSEGILAHLFSFNAKYLCV